MSLVPSFDNVDTTRLTSEQLALITQGKAQISTEGGSATWRYNDRRTAQLVLDFLYLGPSSVARDTAFLRKHGITMLLAVRDVSFAQARFMSMENTAAELGLQADYVDVAGRMELIAAFPMATQKINSHLLSQFRSQGQQAPGGNMAIDNTNFKPGKVLVFCETGNDRSAAIVAAYIMSVYGKGMIETLQFIGLQRFCTNFDEDTKFMLKTYEDILSAQRMVHSQPLEVLHTKGQMSPKQKSNKRGIDDTMDEDDMQDSEFAMDMGRYQDREAFVPFVDPTDTEM